MHIGRGAVKSGERSSSPDPQHAPAVEGCAPAARGFAPRDHLREILRWGVSSAIKLRHSFHQRATL